MRSLGGEYSVLLSEGLLPALAIAQARKRGGGAGSRVELSEYNSPSA